MMKRLGMVVLFVALGCVPSSAQQQNPANTQVYVVPFSHLDLYWACTLEECLDRGNFIIGKATQLALQSTRYRYLLETNVFVSDFMDTHRGTKELEDFKHLVKDGRIEIAPVWAAIYQNQVRDEALVRNVIYGKRYVHDVFGVRAVQISEATGFLAM